MILPSIALAVSLLPGAYAWGAAGHQIVATIAQIHLTPNTQAQLCEILPDYAKCHLAPVAAWADRVRNAYTAPLHYVNGNDDWPGDHCTFGEKGWKDPVRNVLVGVLNSTKGVLELSGEPRDFALRYLVHFMGDIHMPLHLTGRDKGGNDDRVRFDRTITNLHSVWDGRITSKTLRTLTNYTKPLPSKRIEDALQGAIYDPYIRFITWEGIFGWWKDEWLTWPNCPSSGINSIVPNDGVGTPHTQPFLNQDELNIHPWDTIQARLSNIPLSQSTQQLPVCPLHWARPIHELNCNSTLIWPKALSDIPPHTGPAPHIPAQDLIQLDTPEYAGRIRNELVIEKLMAMAGVRLAAILNELLDPQGGGVRVNIV